VRPPAGSELFVKEIALKTGFSLVGITSPVHPAKSKTIYKDWLGAGKHAAMHYLSRWREKRDQPGLLLEGAGSIICVALNYYPGRPGPAGKDGQHNRRGRVSIYSHGRDYHLVVGEMLEDMAAALSNKFPGMRSVACVDNRPVAERTWALQAGIGWLGRNTCLISPQFGSWLFLGELITSLDLRPDQPLNGSCGDCRLCIEACPTGALGEDYSLDANSCISYLTIEHRGDIPEQFHRSIAGRVFGCDECQRVCPHNSAVPTTRIPDFNTFNPLSGLDLKSILSMNDSELQLLAKDSVIARCGPAGLRRNARIALANIESKD